MPKKKKKTLNRYTSLNTCNTFALKMKAVRSVSYKTSAHEINWTTTLLCNKKQNKNEKKLVKTKTNTILIRLKYLVS